MRKALIVGIDYYSEVGISNLSGCVNDAHEVKNVLERHADGSVNFASPKLLTSSSAKDAISRSKLKDSVRDLFSDDAEIALFYFAGHGYIEDTGGFLCGSDCKTGDDGLSLNELLTITKNSPAKNKIIILDSCHSGIAGANSFSPSISEISDGMTILTASTADQYSMEVDNDEGGSGVFTNLFVDALNGAASNILGDITPAGIYAHIDQSLGPWAQRPVFKTNIKSFVSLRRSVPSISLEDLSEVKNLFPRAGFTFDLNPTFEPERNNEQLSDPSFPKPDEENCRKFAILQKLVKVNLVKPVGAPHMWHAAVESKSCALTVLGEHYRQLLVKGLI
jgi:hypothetical protein